MNAGLIVGFVRDKSGKFVEGADVTMFDLFGGAGGRIVAKGDNEIRRGTIRTETDSNGYFELAFAWSGEDIGHTIGGAGRVRMSIYAGKTVWQSKNVNTTYDSIVQFKSGYILKDVLGQSGLTGSDFTNLKDLLEFTKDIIDSVRKLKSHPIFKVNMLSSESWLLLSAANLIINKY